MKQTVQIKGIKEGLVATLGEGEWSELKKSLLLQFDKQINLLRGANVFLDVGQQTLHEADLINLRDAVSERGLTMVGIISKSPVTEQAAQTLGLATRLKDSYKTKQSKTTVASQRSSFEGEKAVLMRRTLRSGSRIEYDGNVVVLGDVNPGAEIIATGSVIVWGKLRGMVHAGAQGAETAVICALDLSPTQLRISNQIAITPPRQGKPKPETARLDNGQVVAEDWGAGKNNPAIL